MKKLLMVMFLLLSLTATCSATNLKHIFEYGDYDSHTYLDTDSIRLAERDDVQHRGFVFRVFWMPSGVDRMKKIALGMEQSNDIALQLYNQDYSYSVQIYELDLKYRMRIIAVEFRNQNNDIIKVMTFKDPPYKDVHGHSQDLLIAKAAYASAKSKYTYIKALPYYEHKTQSYKK